MRCHVAAVENVELICAAASPQLLRRYAQCSIEFAGSVLPGNRRSQFYQSVVTVELAQLTKQFVTYISPGDCHTVGKLERHSFRVGIEFTACVVRKCINLFV